MRRMRGQMSPILASVVLTLVGIGLPGDVFASDAAVAAPPAERPISITLDAGLVAATLGLEVEAQTSWGLVVGAGVGVRRGPGVNGYAGYHVPLGQRWGLRPGVRAARLWQRNDSCRDTCVYDSVIAEVAIRYRSASGFVFEYGVPIFGWAPVGPTGAETEPHLKGYSIATPELAFFSTLLVGYSF